MSDAVGLDVGGTDGTAAGDRLAGEALLDLLNGFIGELRNAGFLSSKKGKLGGYRLAKPADDIIVGEMIRALDGPLAPFPCASRNAYEPCEDCDIATCEVRLLMVRVRDAMGTVLDTYTLAQMRDLSQEQLASFVDYI